MSDLLLDERGVSEIYGYVLLFAILILSITAVSVYGINALENGRDVAIAENMEQGFVGMATAGDNIIDDSAGSRTFQFNPDQGQIKAGEPVRITISVDGSATTNVTTRPLVFTHDDTKIIYVAGAVIRAEDGGAVMVKEPDFRLESSTSIIPVLNLTTPSPDSSIGGRTRIDFARLNDSVVIRQGGNTVAIGIDTVSEQRKNVWKNTFMDQMPGPTCVETSTTTTTCGFSTDNVLIHPVTVEYRLST